MQLSDYSDWITSKYRVEGPNWSSDTVSFGLDMSTQDGAFAGIVLGILFAFTVKPEVAERGLSHLLKRGLLNIPRLADLAEKLPNGPKGTEAVSGIAPDLVVGIKEGYGRIPRLMAIAILRAAERLRSRFRCDARTIYTALDFKPEAVIRELASWNARLHIKSFWVCREMRLQRVWVDSLDVPISGRVCCVVDIQVRRALEHLKCLPHDSTLLALSGMLWESFGELYDYPLLWFARAHCGPRPTLFDCPLQEQCPIISATK